MIEYRAFVRFAASFEAGLALLAVLLGWLAGVRPVGIAPDLRSVVVGLAATLPMIAFYLLAARLPLEPLRRIHDLLMNSLGPALARCRWHELVLLAVLAGVCEELLFRGVLQPWIGRLGTPVGWIVANLLFGLAHAVTPTYFVLAAGIGFYLSGVQWASGGSLAAPMLAHALYDLFAFVQIARDQRRRESGGEPVAAEDDGPRDATG